MYNSPVETIISKMQMQQDGEIFRAVQEIGINVDKDELLKALRYDRGQYDKGYKDGIKEFAVRPKTRTTTHDFGDHFHALVLSSAFIDNLVKEITEESNDQQKT